MSELKVKKKEKNDVPVNCIFKKCIFSPCYLALTFLKIRCWSYYTGTAMGGFGSGRLEPNPNLILIPHPACLHPNPTFRQIALQLWELNQPVPSFLFSFFFLNLRELEQTHFTKKASHISKTPKVKTTTIPAYFHISLPLSKFTCLAWYFPIK